MSGTKRHLRWLAGLVVLISGSALAATFTVMNTGDNGGLNPAVGAGTGTLRQAIVDANAAGGAGNQINFNIPGSGAHTIALASQLPGVSSNLVINGSTQSGYVFNTHAPDQGGINTQQVIEISGGGTLSVGIYASGNVSVVVEHMVLNGFNTTTITGEPNSTGGTLIVRGCFIGTKVDGTAFVSGYGNGGVAIRTGAGHAQIGGTLPGERNLISGNTGGGILVQGPAIIEGNLIGPDASGTLAIGNGPSNNWPGIVLPGNFPNVRVGCTGSGCSSAASRNVISGNHTYGIGIWDGSISGNGTGGLEIKGNYIGTDWTGTQPLPNGDATGGCPNFCGGIQMQGSPTLATPASIIGGFGVGEANLIAHNSGAGIITAYDSVGESFDSRANAIYGNHGVGRANIDIGALGPTANDAGDGDVGANHGQNSPEIVTALIVGSQLQVTYRVDSTSANSAYPLRIDFYANVHGGSGEYIGQDSYAAGDAQQNKTISLSLPLGVQGIPFVATATDANGYTSEFSAAYDVIFADQFE
jgi:hypothetical protein